MSLPPRIVLNFNVGVLGHVDSGKTSLAKALSTVASTACFDKNPQSRERGITLDLGFSSFQVVLPRHLRREGESDDGTSFVQFTLVDCPGHASLIRTIIGGAQIIDLMMLVVDITKGVQTQTAECLVIGEITCDKMLVVLNKVDLIPEDKRTATIDRMSKRLLKTLENTRFAGSPVIAVAAKPGGPEAPEAEAAAVGISELIDALSTYCYWPQRDPQGPFVFSVDHCFSIKGHGTVMTGTVINGSVSVNDTVEIPALKITKKIKSMQMFKKPVESAIQGDRVGICVTQFEAKQLERGLVCKPGSLPAVSAAIIAVSKISYFKQSVATKAKFHITIGHDTVMGRVSFFGLYSSSSDQVSTTAAGEQSFDFSREYQHQDELLSLDAAKSAGEGDQPQPVPVAQFALVELERPVTCGQNFLVIGSKLDSDIHANMCRIAFHGRLVELFTDSNYAETVLPRLKVFKDRCKEGVVERRVDDYSVICRGLFKKESKVDAFVGLKVNLSTGDIGVIEGGFGQSGKFKVRIPAGLGETAKQILVEKSEKKKGKASESAAAASQEPATTGETSIKLFLKFKRYIHDPRKKMIQS